MYALGRLAYYILSCGQNHPADDAAALATLSRDNLALLLPHMPDLEDQFPGAADLLTSWIIERQPVAESLQRQYLLLLAQHQDSIDISLLDGELI